MKSFFHIGAVRKFFSLYSLKNRLVLSLFLNSVMPIVIIGCISYFYIHSINVNKVQNGIQSNVSSMKASTDDILSGLNYASLQIMYSSNMINNIEKLFSSDKMFELVKITNDIDENLRLVNFTNPKIEFMFFYFSEQEMRIISESKDIRADFDSKNLPLLFKQFEISYYGPHKSNFKNKNITVLSVIRTLNIPGIKPVYIYIESDYNQFQNNFNHEYGMDIINLIADDKNRILYSQDNQNFPSGALFNTSDRSDRNTYKSHGDFYVFESASKNGWRILTAIKKGEYNREIDKWLIWLVLVGILFLVVSLLLALMILRTVYTPIKIFNREIQQITDNHYDSKLQLVHINEFDELLVKFKKMAERIKCLLHEVKQKEKLRRHLEVEKLLYQINPHFLHNTLDTLRWMARTNGQDDIDHLASSLNKVLHYNLGKLGDITTVQNEIEILKDYIAIQKMRYEYNFDIRINLESGVEDIRIPRFILQPLVENSLHHGLKENMVIDVTVVHDGQTHIRAIVKDNGAGMNESAIKALLEPNYNGNSEVRHGIGLSYVISMVKVYYGEDADIYIESTVGAGTSITLRVPVDLPSQEPADEGAPV